MASVLDVVVGLALAVMSWVLLESTQYSWWTTTSQGARAPYFEAVLLVAAGCGLLLVAQHRIVRPRATIVVVALLIALVVPAVLGLGAWWPAGLPGSAERLASFPGTYLVIGMWLAVGATKWRRSAAADGPVSAAKPATEPSR